MVDNNITFTENLDWIKTIESNIYVNRGHTEIEPKVVGFYSIYTSSKADKLKTKKPGMEEVQRYMILIPTMEDYFMAAVKQSEFIRDIIE